MSRKRLDKDDLSLWKKVTERTEKLDVDKLFRAEIDGTSPIHGPTPTAPQIRKRSSVVMGKPDPKPRRNTHDLMPSLPDQLRQAPVQMDSKAFGKLKRVKMRPEGRIDLHGMT
ncbi:MAG TPA: DNA mismatch repair protein MutS, partial [Sulfitobacter sp.]|nr:DNA mismatch repair protein MutS [Sulfitobacter sp.]